jgi:hypothetical protein
VKQRTIWGIYSAPFGNLGLCRRRWASYRVLRASEALFQQIQLTELEVKHLDSSPRRVRRGNSRCRRLTSTLGPLSGDVIGCRERKYEHWGPSRHRRGGLTWHIVAFRCRCPWQKASRGVSATPTINNCDQIGSKKTSSAS